MQKFGNVLAKVTYGETNVCTIWRRRVTFTSDKQLCTYMTCLWGQAKPDLDFLSNRLCVDFRIKKKTFIERRENLVTNFTCPRSTNYFSVNVIMYASVL